MSEVKWFNPYLRLPYDDKRYNDMSVTVYLLLKDGREVPGYYDRRLNCWYCYDKEYCYLRLETHEVTAWRRLYD